MEVDAENSGYKWKAFVSNVLKPDKEFVERLGEHEIIESVYHINTEKNTIYSSYIAKAGDAFVKASYKMNSNEYGISGFYTVVEIVGKSETVDEIEEALSHYIKEIQSGIYTTQEISKRDI